MRYLVSRWHPGLCKHAITRVTWQTTRSGRSPFGMPEKLLGCVHLFVCLILGGLAQTLVCTRLPLPPLCSDAHSELVRAFFGFTRLGLQTCISLVCVLSHIWPSSTAVSRTCFRLILADCKLRIITPLLLLLLILLHRPPFPFPCADVIAKLLKLTGR